LVAKVNPKDAGTFRVRADQIRQPRDKVL
jgi:hypothetical protein